MKMSVQQAVQQALFEVGGLREILQMRPVTPKMREAYRTLRAAYMQTLMPREKHTFAGQAVEEPEKVEVGG